MLRLRSQALRHLGTICTCSPCLATATRTPAPSGLQSSIAARRRIDDDRSRAFHTVSSRRSERTTEPAAPTESLQDAGNPQTETQLSEKQKRRLKHKAALTEKRVAAARSRAENRAPGSGPPENAAQQLVVLQGALAALKNVLGQQNINIDNIKKPKNKKKKKAGKSQIEQSQPSTAEDKPASSTAEQKTESASPEKESTKSTVQKAQPDDIKASKSKGDPEPEPAPPISEADREELELRKRQLADMKEKLDRYKKSSSRIKHPLQRGDTGSKKQSETKSGNFVKNTITGAASSPANKAPLAERLNALKPKREGHPKAQKSKVKTQKQKPAQAKPKKSKPVEEPDVHKKSPLHISKLSPEELELVPIEKSQPPVAVLAHGLERALFNPGVYHLQDPRSKVYNFDPYLANIMPIQEFDFDALQQYVTSSKDTALIDVARENGKKYTGSTSSMTSMLSHFHYLLSAWREINSSMMSRDFEVPSQQFTRLLRAPAAVFLHWKDGVYAIDADKEFDSASILSMLGKSMEKLLTLPVDGFEKYRRGKSHQISEQERNAPEAYHYTGLRDFMMRSQLDAYDPRVPGSGMFDIKTRAVVSIRMDSQGFTKGLGYELRHRHGNWESFEREYHDMIRAAFLKYSLQVRMGRMDGIFVAFHNTERIFGFQYIPLEEMDLSLHGTSDLTTGDKEFKLSLALLNELLDRASKKFPEKSLRLFVETRTSVNTPFMYAFVKPVERGEIEAVQDAGKESVAEFEREILGLKRAIESESETSPDAENEAEETAVADGEENNISETPEELEVEEEEDTTASWDEIQAMVEDAMEDEELGVDAVRQAIEDALEESGLLEEQTPEEVRGYVDALLSALTDGSGDPATASVEESEGSQLVDSETRDVSVSAQNENQDLDDLSEPAQMDGSDEARVQTEEQTDEESELEKDDSQDDSSSPNMTTLSNLILRMTRRLDESGVAEKQAEDAVSSKLQVFERILGKIISESREDEQDSGDSGAVNRASEPKNVTERTGSSSADIEDTTTPASNDAPEAAAGAGAEPEDRGPILGMVLTVRNKVNDQFVPRPENLTKEDTWEVEYNIEELPEERAHRLFDMCKKRRETAYSKGGQRSHGWNEMFDGALPRYTRQGRKFRSEENAEAKQRPVYVLGESQPKSYQEVFGEQNED
ncbi:mitochondrial protein Pet127-domain-containing protein [Truncatella angustata]|uniref:Mitochondrial protein Pet127-domain-containing protein n=1 Tax=Truncatella angustata TaxID=152316 RepID=A0A9P8ZXL7_9PEZI|nr:mitochondrial protein Pet127-domain-containing protein [Truncatella angustata]KAH6655026.1 mitochondrial protein Pet127-domain-containing protein [Truncatella angustata]KAH8196103.1 hypothetical protein TruAng_009730 [Truncatella angustata]